MYDEYNGIKIPFLNGGLFSPVQDYNWRKTNFNIPNSIWFNKDKKDEDKKEETKATKKSS